MTLLLDLNVTCKVSFWCTMATLYTSFMRVTPIVSNFIDRFSLKKVTMHSFFHHCVRFFQIFRCYKLFFTHLHNFFASLRPFFSDFYAQ